MSCDWDVYCLDCKVGMGFDNQNRRVDLMRALCRGGPGLAAFWPVYQDIGFLEVHTDGRAFVDMEWFGAHGNHRLVPRSEYGDIDGTCGERYSCEHGGHFVCHRPVGHAPPHSNEDP